MPRDNVLMSRNSDGQVTLPSGSFTVPQDRSALSFFNGANRIRNGDVFDKDGWVYNGGNKVRKWFITIDKYRVWEPRLKDLKELELIRWKIVENYNNFDGFKDVFKKCSQYKNFYSKVKDKFRVFTVYPGEGVSNNLMNKPKGSHKPELIREYFEMQRISWKKATRTRFATAVFEKSVMENYLDQFYYNPRGDTKRFIHLIINGRDYWFNKSFGYENIRLCYPEDVGTIFCTEVVD